MKKSHFPVGRAGLFATLLASSVATAEVSSPVAEPDVVSPPWAASTSAAGGAAPAASSTLAEAAGTAPEGAAPPPSAAVTAPPFVQPEPVARPTARAASSVAPAEPPPSVPSPPQVSAAPSALATPSAPTIAVTFRAQPIFFVANDGTPAATNRAAQLSEALQHAIEADARARPDAPNVEIVEETPGKLTLFVRGYPVGVLFERDATAARADSLGSYQSSLHQGLTLFVADQRRKAALQGSALRFVVAAAAMLVALLLVRLVRHLSARADEYLDDQAASLPPIRILGVPIVGADTLSATLALTVSVGRIMAYIGLLSAGLAVAMYQFALTRPWVNVVLRWGSERFVHAAEELLLALPRVLLAAFLLVLGSAGLRVARVLFDDTLDTKTPWGTVPVRRARVLRVVVPIAIFVVIVPLAIAAAFGRFHTPIELLIVAGLFCVALGLAPVCASGAVGLLTLWRGRIQQNTEVSIRGVQGRVVGLSPWELEIESSDGSRTSLPMLCLLNEPLIQRQSSARELLLVLTRGPSVQETLSTLQAFLGATAPGATCRCTGFEATTLDVSLALANDADLEKVVLALAGHPAGLSVKSLQSREPSASRSGTQRAN